MTMLLAYARQRLFRRDVFAVIVLMAVVAHPARGQSSVAEAAVDLAIAAGLVFAFRAWDDVMDRDLDGRRDPARVLARATSIAPVVIASGCTGALAAVACAAAHGAGSGLLLASFALVLARWYRTRRSRTGGGDRLLLAKYAVFTLALIGPGAFGPGALIAAGSVYLAACLHEWRHDRGSRVFSIGGWK
jgi:hypothetical protein